MVFVDGRWQEVKLGCLYTEQGRVQSKLGRGELTERQVVGVRGSPEALGEVLWPRSCSMGAESRKVVILGDGAPWIWNLAEELFTDRVEILDWYHATRISAVWHGWFSAKAPTKPHSGANRNSTVYTKTP